MTFQPVMRRPWLLVPLCLCVILARCSPGEAFKCGLSGNRARQRSSKASTALRYSSDPMAQADSSKGGACPFIDTSFNIGTYDVPVLFSDDDSRPIILFDGSCNMCNAAVQLLLSYDSCRKDKRGNLRFAALQSQVGLLLCRRMSDETREQVLNKISPTDTEAEKYRSIVVCTSEKTYTRSGAALLIGRALGGRLKPLRYLSILAYAVPTKLRDVVYNFVSRRRRSWFGSSSECLLWDDNFDTRFVDDGVLTGTYRDPWADPNAEPEVVTGPPKSLFDTESPPVRGDKVRIVWPVGAVDDPSITFLDSRKDGVCLAGGTGTIATIDLPMRVVLKVDRDSIGLTEDDTDEGGDTVYAWVKPSEVGIL